MSFGLGKGRSLDAGEAGFDISTLPRSDEGRLHPNVFFATPTPRVEIEIGSGKGTFLLQQASLQPETNFLGIEWTGEFWKYAADRVRRSGLKNVRILRGDATQFLRHWVEDGAAQVVHLYFSDPWPKTRHHKRRVVQDQTLADFHRVLAPEGELRIVTDHDALWAWDVEHVDRAEHLFTRRDFTPPASAGEGELVGTNFERKFRREGRPFHAMTLVRKSS